MSELLKEISFDITKSQEVDLSQPSTQKKRRKKRNDDYDYDDDFIESFDGETDLVDIECSLSNFFVYQGPLPYSTKKVLNFFKNKPNLTYENVNEVDVLEEALCISRRRRKASRPSVCMKKNTEHKINEESKYEEFEFNKKKIPRQKKNPTILKKEYRYKEMILNYLFGKLDKLKGEYSLLSVDDKILYFIVNFLFFKDDLDLYEKNLQVLAEEKNTCKSNLNINVVQKEENVKDIIFDHSIENNDVENNKQLKPVGNPEHLTKSNELLVPELKQEIKSVSNSEQLENNNEFSIQKSILEIKSLDKAEKNINDTRPHNISVQVTNNSKFFDNSEQITSNSQIPDSCNESKSANQNDINSQIPNSVDLNNTKQIKNNLDLFNYSVPLIKSSNKLKHSPSIDPALYVLLEEFFTENDLNQFVINMISKIDTAFMSITVYANNNRNYESGTYRFLGFNDNIFMDQCLIYFSSYVVKHYSNNTSHDIVYYFNEAKRSVMDAFVPGISNKVKTLYFVNVYFKTMIEEDKYDY